MKYLIIILLLASCYSQKKATEQFNKAALNYPEIPATFCANEFPVKDSVIKDTVITTDTVLIQSGITEDTIIVKVKDTLRVTIIRELPGKVITNTIHIRDTIIRENTAALKSCEIDKSKAIGLLVKKTDEAEKYKGQAKKRGLFMWGLLALIAAYIGLRIYLRTKKIIK